MRTLRVNASLRAQVEAGTTSAHLMATLEGDAQEVAPEGDNRRRRRG